MPFGEMLNREEWLQRASHELQNWLNRMTGQLQPHVYVSVGFTGHPVCQLDKVLGACWSAKYQHDGRPHIFISPIVDGEPWAKHGVLHVLLHELCHAACRCQDHGRDFWRVAKPAGLLPPWRTTPDMLPETQDMLMTVANKLGPWAHTPIAVLQHGSRKPRRAVELLAGTEIGHEARLVIPSETKDNRPLPEHMIADILLEVAKLFGGFTSWVANGGYVMADGKLKTEKVCVVDIVAPKNTTTREQLERIAHDIHQQGEQESVYLRLPGGRVELV